MVVGFFVVFYWIDEYEFRNLFEYVSLLVIFFMREELYMIRGL